MFHRNKKMHNVPIDRMNSRQLQETVDDWKDLGVWDLLNETSQEHYLNRIKYLKMLDLLTPSKS